MGIRLSCIQRAWPSIPFGLLFLAASTHLPATWAQMLSKIEGKVLDAKGAPVPAATVRLYAEDPGPPEEVVSQVDGSFSFDDLPPGDYRLEVEMQGFDKTVREGVNPVRDESHQLKIVLQRPKPAAAARTAPSNSPAKRPGGGQNGSSGSASPGFRDVDLTGMAEADATQTLPSNTPSDARAASTGDNSDLLVISGNSSASIDAGDWNNPEFRQRMREAADRMGFGGLTEMGPGGPGGDQGGRGFGQFGGGGFGGGMRGGPGGGGGFGGRGMSMRQSRFNGSAYSNYRNSVFNARTYSLTGQEVSKPLQIQDNFGVSIGGPLPWGAKSAVNAGGPRRGGGGASRQPGMWFFSYDGTRNRNPYDILTTVPTALERSGDFSQTIERQGQAQGNNAVIYDPTTGKPFPSATIPSSRLNSASLGLLAYIPLPNLPGQVQNFTMQRGLASTSDRFSGRFNTRLTAKDNVFANYDFLRGDNLSSQIFPGLDSNRTNRSQNAVIGGIHRFKPRFIANVRFTFNRVRNLSSNAFAYTNDVAGDLGINGISRDAINYGIPTATFTNYGALQLGNPYLNRTQAATLNGAVTRIGSKHTFSSGGSISWNQRNTQTDPNARGTFDFSGFATSAFDAKGFPIAGTGYDFADFLLGLPYSTSRRFGSSNNYLRDRSFNFYAQDNWRIRSNLTLNAGLRYEYNGPYYELYNRMVGLDVAPDLTAVAQVFPGQAGPYSGTFPRSLVRGDKNNFGPRIGLAWKPRASSRVVIRAGYGLFYNPSVYPYIASQLIGQPPFAVNQSLLTTLTDPLTLQNGFPTDPSVTIRNTYAIDPNYRQGYVQQWNLHVQTLVFKIYSIEAGYNGAKGTRLDILRSPNRAPAGVSPGDTQNNLDISNAGLFLLQQSGANSILHSGRVGVTRRFSHGFRLNSSYIFSKSIDDASGVGGGSLVVVQNDHNIDAERSLSSYDQRHRFQTDFNVELPFGAQRKYLANANRFVQGVVSGWNLNGTYQLFSGTPLTARVLGNQSNNSGTGSNASERPDSTGLSASLPGGQSSTAEFFNTLAFVLPQPGQFGNAGRNTITGPGTNLLNLTLRKNFRLDDNDRRLEVRWLVTNVLNHPNYASIGTVVNAVDFGRVTSVAGMRQMGIDLRLNF